MLEFTETRKMYALYLEAWSKKEYERAIAIEDTYKAITGSELDPEWCRCWLSK